MDSFVRAEGVSPCQFTMHRGSAGASLSQEGEVTVPRSEESDGRVSIPSDAPGQGDASAQAGSIFEANLWSADEQTNQQADSLTRPAQNGGRVHMGNLLEGSRAQLSAGEPLPVDALDLESLGSDTLIDIGEPDPPQLDLTMDESMEELRGDKPKATTRIQAKELTSMMQRLGKGIEDSYQGTPDVCWTQVREDLVRLEQSLMDALGQKVQDHYAQNIEYVDGTDGEIIFNSTVNQAMGRTPRTAPPKEISNVPKGVNFAQINLNPQNASPLANESNQPVLGKLWANETTPPSVGQQSPNLGGTPTLPCPTTGGHFGHSTTVTYAQLNQLGAPVSSGSGIGLNAGTLPQQAVMGNSMHIHGQHQSLASGNHSVQSQAPSVFANASIGQILQRSSDDYYFSLPMPFNITPYQAAPAHTELRKMIKDNLFKDSPIEYPHWRRWFLDNVHSTLLPVAAKCDALCRCLEENKKVELIRQHTSRDEEGYKDLLVELEKVYGGNRHVKTNFVKYLRSVRNLRATDSQGIKALAITIKGFLRSGKSYDDEDMCSLVFSLFSDALKMESRIYFTASQEPSTLPGIHKFLVAQLSSLERVDEKAQLHADFERASHHVKFGDEDELPGLGEQMKLLDLSLDELLRLRAGHQAASFHAQSGNFSKRKKNKRKKGNKGGQKPDLTFQAGGSTSQPPATQPQPPAAPGQALPAQQIPPTDPPQAQPNQNTQLPAPTIGQILQNRHPGRKRVLTVKEIFCPDCKTKQELRKCPLYLALFPKERELVCFARKCCYKCTWQGHLARECPHRFKCDTCGSSQHHSTLHRHRPDPGQPGNSPKAQSNSRNNFAHMGFRLKNSSKGETKDEMPIANVMSLRFAVVRIKGLSGKEVVINALLDDGSNRSLIEEKLARDLGLDFGRKHHLALKGVGNEVHEEESFLVKFNVQSMDGKHDSFMHAATAQAPVGELWPTRWNRFRRFWKHMSDVPFDEGPDKPVQMLIGSDYNKLMMCQEERVLSSWDVPSPIARKTPLGWTATGPLVPQPDHRDVRALAKAEAVLFARTYQAIMWTKTRPLRKGKRLVATLTPAPGNEPEVDISMEPPLNFETLPAANDEGVNRVTPAEMTGRPVVTTDSVPTAMLVQVEEDDGSTQETPTFDCQERANVSNKDLEKLVLRSMDLPKLPDDEKGTEVKRFMPHPNSTLAQNGSEMDEDGAGDQKEDPKRPQGRPGRQKKGSFHLLPLDVNIQNIVTLLPLTLPFAPLLLSTRLAWEIKNDAQTRGANQRAESLLSSYLTIKGMNLGELNQFKFKFRGDNKSNKLTKSTRSQSSGKVMAPRPQSKSGATAKPLRSAPETPGERVMKAWPSKKKQAFERIMRSTEHLSSSAAEKLGLEDENCVNMEIPDGMMAMLAKRSREYRKRGSYKLSPDEMPPNWPVRGSPADRVASNTGVVSALDKLRKRAAICRPFLLLDEHTDVPITFINSGAKWIDAKERIFRSIEEFGAITVGFADFHPETLKAMHKRNGKTITEANAKHLPCPALLEAPTHNFVIFGLCEPRAVVVDCKAVRDFKNGTPREVWSRIQVEGALVVGSHLAHYNQTLTTADQRDEGKTMFNALSQARNRYKSIRLAETPIENQIQGELSKLEIGGSFTGPADWSPRRMERWRRRAQFALMCSGLPNHIGPNVMELIQEFNGQGVELVEGKTMQDLLPRNPSDFLPLFRLIQGNQRPDLNFSPCAPDVKFGQMPLAKLLDSEIGPIEPNEPLRHPCRLMNCFGGNWARSTKKIVRKSKKITRKSKRRCQPKRF